MKVLVALNPDMLDEICYENAEYIQLGKARVLIGNVELSEPSFDENDEKNKDHVLVRVDAFSCNFRDKGILLHNYELMMKNKRAFLPFGSEFCGEIVKKGKNVNEYSVGDIVIPDCRYEEMDSKEVAPGITTNFASLGWLRLNKNKIVKKPDSFGISEGAAFGLGAETAASMIRKSGILEADVKKPIVFSANSATSLFIIQALLAHGIEPICISSKKPDAEYPFDVKRDSTDNIEKYFGTATHAFDPFFDINILNAVSTLNMGGKYIYCGMVEQHPLLSEKDLSEYTTTLREALKIAIVKNISIIGNCLGTHDDIVDAGKLYERKGMKPVVEGIYKVYEGMQFLGKSFLGKNAPGKCVMTY
ncbi:MDR/zinc-dependent alcohol dehydrogenase-like family protein [Eubacterium ruminantium]|uniref:NADPH:quinone reductase n=1 Tax=Eubacterium ruminantium TaxID=42322 RepID=A0A1T4N756_9FIRM|nr:medium chain dehydrogenase/reductase family protein [Eubacterium ruminantium]SCW52059.1 NADPH:quinone reductase [Eubacterium ruminantium]SDM64754.1 NADPH:quinone reductase [Eubacterium ruminantium]SJZ74916.1 NADPH:quinone reductase [Eubacterium ruminantium]